MTEEEAKTKICPIMSGPALGHPEKSSFAYPGLPIHCKASSCMMWRFNYDNKIGGQKPETGYCGLVK